MFETKSTHRLGNDGFIWFYGLVEDIKDPLKLGRLRIRILGDHTQSKKQNRIPTDSLPWAYPISGINSASVNGIGVSPTGIINGTWVYGFYADGMDKQQPMVQGTFGGIPEAIAWYPEKEDESDDSEEKKINVQMGFQDPEGKFPLGKMIFEQDTNRLARGAQGGSIEVPESIVPTQEKECDDGICPEEPKLSIQYHDKFDWKYVKKYAKGENQEVEKKDDKQKQYKLDNNHPFTVFKFVNRERRVPISKPFSDPAHREEWHEPQNPYAAEYPYNTVFETAHGDGGSDVYGYDSTITGYDGSDKEGLHRKQNCGAGSWGLGQEWDNTEGAKRYHRFHPAGNYFEIDNDGNEVNKIYGDAFEINLKDKSIVIKGDWNVTVEGDKNELIEGDYNLQVMGDMNTDIRGNSQYHVEKDLKTHVRGNNIATVDQDQTNLVRGSRSSMVLVKDLNESQIAERHADTIIRKGATSIEDEGFMMYSLKAHEGTLDICNYKSQIDTWEHKSMDFLLESKKMKRVVGEFEEKSNFRDQWIKDYTIHADNYLLLFGTSYATTKAPFVCPECEEAASILVEFDQVSYCETECIDNQCKPLYNECVQAALSACSTTLIEPRTGEPYTRVDWEKYHASVDSCQRSYDNCVSGCSGCKSDICSPSTTGASWSCEASHDPNCPVGDKEIIKLECAAKPILIDPWENLSMEKP